MQVGDSAWRWIFSDIYRIWMIDIAGVVMDNAGYFRLSGFDGMLSLCSILYDQMGELVMDINSVKYSNHLNRNKVKNKQQRRYMA